MFGLKSKKDEYADVKELFNSIVKEKNEFDLDWMKLNVGLIKRLFVGKPNLHVWVTSDMENSTHKGSIEDIVLDDDMLTIKSSDFVVDFYKPSHGCFDTRFGIGNMYSMEIYSKDNLPSKITLFYHNI